jgi:site-specific DNA-methyltransferase (adenine-specific)
MMEQIKIIQGDCLEAMATLPDTSIDMILTDLPYGTTYAPWDNLIPFNGLWFAWKRIIKDKGAIVLTASQPFTSYLVLSNPKWFRCEWIWDKLIGSNFANANRQPLKVHENVLVFASGQTTYNPQKTLGTKNHSQGTSSKEKGSELLLIKDRTPDDLSGLKFPKSIQTFSKHSSQSKLHSTQKPAELFEYLIRTYSNVGETVLDCTAGSGTTGEAAIKCGRKAILIDNDPACIEIMHKRLDLCQSTPNS